MEQIQVIAGSIAGLMFSAGSLNMVIKAWQTKDLRSYSLGQIMLNNIGNLFYWLYVISLPFGPIYVMHSFFTLVSLFMLIWYFLYQTGATSRKVPDTLRPIVAHCVSTTHVAQMASRCPEHTGTRRGTLMFRPEFEKLSV